MVYNRRMTTKTYPVRLEPDLLEQANIVFKRLGLTKADAIRVFLTRVVAEQALPFDMNYIPNAKTRKVLDDAKQGKDIGAPQSLADFAKEMREL